jgi:hypothetical protein
MKSLSRRDFLAGVSAAAAGALLPPLRSMQGPLVRIDVHQHFVSPDYYALLTRKNASSPVPGYGIWNNYSPARNIEEMDKAGVQTSMLSYTAPGVWFGDAAEARRLARELNEFAAAKMVGAYKGRFGLFAILPQAASAKSNTPSIRSRPVAWACSLATKTNGWAIRHSRQSLKNSIAAKRWSTRTPMRLPAAGTGLRE